LTLRSCTNPGVVRLMPLRQIQSPRIGMRYTPVGTVSVSGVSTRTV
jgi:hypothetical protein